MSSLPVIYYHTGNQDYLRLSLELCRQFNKDVILLGNESNREMAEALGVSWYSAEAYKGGPLLERFDNAYRHFSTNTEAFEKMCFERFFVINNFLNTADIQGADKFVYLDSDILSYVNYSELDACEDYDFGMCVPENQDNYGWTANCGISFFSVSALGQLVSYFVEVYENHLQMLEDKWNYHRNNNVPGGICDMTLEYLFYRDTKLKALNLAVSDNKLPGIMDVNVNSADNFKASEYQTDDVLKIKKIIYQEDGMPYFIRPDGSLVKVMAIHFNGPAKRYMDTYARNKMCTKDIYNSEKRKLRKQTFKNSIKKLLGK